MKVKLKDIKANPNNPRVIKDEQFKKLVKSIEEFPEMLSVRKLVCTPDMIVLGGNMRLRALQSLGIKEIEVELVDWDEQKQKEFIIKDNVSFGEWNHEQLLNEWDSIDLQDWGLELPVYTTGHDANNLDEMSLDIDEEFNPLGKASNLHKIVFMFNNENDAQLWFTDKLQNQYDVKKYGGMSNKIWQINLSDVYGK